MDLGDKRACGSSLMITVMRLKVVKISREFIPLTIRRLGRLKILKSLFIGKFFLYNSFKLIN